jgi:cellulose/xylan binding protein with CBM9 domain
MQYVRAMWRPVVWLWLFASTALAADLAELESVGDAQTFGWSALPGASLQVERAGKVGRYALRSAASATPKLYMGLKLRRELDLTGAGSKDAIVFYVKQNFGRSICINLRMGEAHVYRYADIKHGQWSRVELDLDMAHWSNPKNAPWGKVTSLSIYSRGFDADKEYMILDGFSAVVGGRSLGAGGTGVHTMRRWRFPYQTDAAWYLGNGDVAWAISKATGQVRGGWNVKTRERYLNHGEGRYHLEDIKQIVTGREQADKVLRAAFSAKAQTVTLFCANAAVPTVKIRKDYRLDDRRLFKKTTFTYSGKSRKFITFNSETALTPGYRDGGYYMGAGYVGPLVPAPELSQWRKALDYQNTSKGMLLHQPMKKYSFAHVRTRLDGQFVWPWFGGAVSGYNERMNVLSYTPDGWDMSLSTSPLDPGKTTSYEEYLAIVPGGWYEFLSDYYPSKPEVRKALAKIPPVPTWMKDVKVFTDVGRSGIPHVKRLVESIDDGNIIVLLGSWGSLGDYYIEEGLVGAHGGFITGPELKDFIRRLKALSPRVKVGIYQWVLSATYEARILKKHPEWFRWKSKRGDEFSTFPGMASNYAAMLSIPECYREMMAHFERALSYLDVDLIYLDDPKAVNMVDWHSGEYVRDDISYRFFLDLRRLVAKHGPDKMLFFNARGNPYGDVNFIEARGQLRDGYWRHFVGIGSCIEAFLTCRPEARIVPLYWIPSLSREYVNRSLALGWILSVTYRDSPGATPFLRAAYEMGNTSPVAGTYAPDWKRDKDTLIESYLTRRPSDAGYLLSFISHEKEHKTVPVTIKLDSLDLDRKGTILVWDHVVADATQYEGRVTERVVKSVYEKSGWSLDRAIRRRLLYMGPYRKTLEFKLPMETLILHQLYITSQQAGVYAVGDMPGNYLFGTTTDVTTRTTRRPGSGVMEVQVNSKRDGAEIIVYPPKGKQVHTATLNGKAATPIWVEEGGLPCPVFTVGKGRHVLKVRCEDVGRPAPPPRSIEATGSSQALAVRVPGLARALVCVADGAGVSYSRMITGRGGVFSVPLPDDRPAGTYRVSVGAGMTADGTWWRGKPLRCSVQIAGASVDLGLTGKWNAQVIPGERKVLSVDKTIRGVHVLRTAVHTTDTPRAGWQPGLKALTAKVDVDALTLEAGTTRKIINFLGGAFAGMEVRNLRKVRVRLANTFHDAYQLRGKGSHGPGYWPSSRSFSGFVVDYHTAQGYTKRVNLAVGLLHPKCSTALPAYGRGKRFDEVYDLGKLVDEGPEKTVALDLARYAPKGWDGRVWFSVGSDWVGSGRQLTAQILAVNDAVTEPCLVGVNPKDVLQRYKKQRTLTVTRKPGVLVIDGVLDDEMWPAAAKTEEFFLLGGGGVSEAGTLAMFYYDDEHLYLGIRCKEPGRRRPVVRHGSVWHDDDVEIYIDANRDGKTFAQILVNGAGGTAEFRDKNPATIGALAKVSVSEGQWWDIELAIPFKGMGVKAPKAGDQWRINVVRQRQPGQGVRAELITWAPLEKSFFELRNLGSMTFK